MKGSELLHFCLSLLSGYVRRLGDYWGLSSGFNEAGSNGGLRLTLAKDFFAEARLSNSNRTSLNAGGNVSLFLGEIDAFNPDLLALFAFHNGPWDTQWILIPAGDVNLLNR